MRYLLTTCSENKDPADGMLPARQRYQSEFIDQVIAEGERTQTPVLILSGQFGLLDLDTEIPYYNHLLTEDEIPKMLEVVAAQLESREDESQTEITAYMKRARTEPGWGPYYMLLEQATHEAGVNLQYVEPESFEPRAETIRMR